VSRPEPNRANPATGSPDPPRTELRPEEEPTTTGTLFLTVLILMIIGAIWVVMYLKLLSRGGGAS